MFFLSLVGGLPLLGFFYPMKLPAYQVISTYNDTESFCATCGEIRFFAGQKIVKPSVPWIRTAYLLRVICTKCRGRHIVINNTPYSSKLNGYVLLEAGYKEYPLLDIELEYE